MANERNHPANESDRNMNKLEGQSTIPGDLPDSPQDREKLRGEETYIDLPDVKDIPGQEFVHVPSLGEMADTTAASDDEEGVGIFEDSDGARADNDSDVRPDERQALRDTLYMPTRDEDNLRQARMDNVDFEGVPLNEASFGAGQSLSGDDLDSGEINTETVSNSNEDDDEENQDYSVDDSDADEPSENRQGV